MTDLVKRLEEIESSLSAGPWSRGALWEAIRHVQRNTDVMEDALNFQDDDEPKGLPGRYDGHGLADLRNLLPTIITALSQADGYVRVPREPTRDLKMALCEGLRHDGFEVVFDSEKAYRAMIAAAPSQPQEGMSNE